MPQAIAIILAALVVACFAAALNAFRRTKQLEDRLDAICGPLGQAATEQNQPAFSSARVVHALAIPGVASDSAFVRIYLVLAFGTLVLTAGFAGWKTAIAAALLGFLGHIAYVRWKRRKQAREFADGLPALLERARRLVLIGNSLPQAFVEAVTTADPVIRNEMDPIVRRIRHGAPFTESIDMLARQIDIIELHMLAAYVRTNTKFGGRVAQTLVNLINQLGNKRRLEREIASTTAETRASAVILFGLMALTMIGMAAMNPRYLDFYLDSDSGRMILLGILAWPLLGVLVMRRILVLDF